MSDKKDKIETVSKHYHLRLDENSTTTSASIMLWLTRQNATVKSFILSKEGNGQTIKYHYHLYIEFIEEIKKDTLDKRVKRTFSNRGTTSSIAICRDVEKTRTYVIKDGDVLKTKGFTKEALLDYEERSYQKKKKDPFDNMLSELKRRKIDTEEGIVQYVFDYYKGKRMYWNHMVSLIRGLNSVINPEEENSSFSQFYYKFKY